MRPLLFFSLVLGGVLCLGAAAQAQQQESRIEKILKPDRNQSFDLMQAKKFGSKSFDSKTSRNFQLKSVSTPQKFNAKEFLTGKFHNEKSFWMGDFKYSAGENFNLPHSFQLPKNFSTNAVVVNRATGLDKHYDAANIPTRDYRGTERNKMRSHLTPQQAAQNGYDAGELKELKSIDDVRALLNKSK